MGIDPLSTPVGGSMLKPLNLYLIQHDDEVLGLDAVTIAELQKVVEMNGAILWDMQGDLRILPCNIIADHIRVAAARYESERLNRAIGLPSSEKWKLKISFIWDQARPITSAELASATTRTA
jgi:hypothetical protein